MRHGQILIATLLASLLSGCSTVGSVTSVLASSVANTFSGEPRPAYLHWGGLLISTSADANGNSPIAFDIVFVRDQATLEKLQVLSAARWFTTRQEWQRIFPDTLIVRSLELVPDQTLRLTESELGSPLVAGVLLFANYATAGEHQARLSLQTDGALVRLGPADFTVINYKF